MFSSRPPRGSRRKRTKYNKNQLKVLVEAFEKEPYLDPTEREELAKRIQFPESRIQVWFQNHRARTPKHFQRPCGKAAVAPGSLRVDSTPLPTALASRAFSATVTPTELSRAMPADSPGAWGAFLVKPSSQGT